MLAAAEAAQRLATPSFASGVYPIERVFRFDEFPPALKSKDVSFEESLPADSPGLPR